MSQNFIKALDPYEDSNHKPVKGKYHYMIPLDIEPACYSMNIDYESHDEANPDAYQYDGWIVVGHHAYLRSYPIIIPYKTSATSEDAITLYEKRNTTFNMIVDAFSDKNLTKAINNLPLYFRVLKGQFKDYYENENTARANVNKDYNNASVSNTVVTPLKTGSNGRNTTNISVSDIYTVEETINDINTLIFKCMGTRDRGTDNYVPTTVEVPLIIGTTNVQLISTSKLTKLEQENLSFALPATSIWRVATCGRGQVEMGIDIIYAFAQRSDTENNGSKYHYESYRTDRSKFVKVGSVKLQYNLDDGNGWVTVPASELASADIYTTIQSDGSIIQKSGSENGGIKVLWSNKISYPTQKLAHYRWVYSGKPGATFGKYSTSYEMAIDPSLGTPVSWETRVVLTSSGNNIAPNEETLITGKLQVLGANGAWWTPTNAKGVATITLPDGSKYTSDIGEDGIFSVPLSFESAGTYTLSVGTHDSTGVFDDASNTIKVNVEPYPTKLTLSATNTNITPNESTTISGKLQMQTSDGVWQDYTKFKGDVVLTLSDNSTETITVSKNGTFSKTLSWTTEGTKGIVANYHDSTRTFADSTSSINVKVKKIETKIESLTISPTSPTQADNITIKCQLKVKDDNGAWVTPTNAKGTAVINIDDKTATISVPADGIISYTTASTFTSGKHDVNITTSDSSNKFASASASTSFTVQPKLVTSINLSDKSLILKNGDSYTFSGSVVASNATSNTDYTGTLTDSISKKTFTVAKDGTFTATGTTNKNSTVNGKLTYAGTKVLDGCEVDVSVQTKTFDVTITRNSSTYTAYDKDTDNENSNIRIRLNDEYNKPVTKGVLNIYLHPTYYEYTNKIEPIKVATLNLSQADNGLFEFDAGTLITTTFINTFKNKDWHPFFRHELTVSYTDSTDAYNDTNTLSTTYLTYKVKNPQIQYSVARLNSGASYPVIGGQTITTFDNDGDVSSSSAIDLHDVKMLRVVFGVKDSYGNYIGGIKLHDWITNEHDMTIYAQDTEGNFLTYNGNKIPANYNRTVKKEKTITDSNGNETTIIEEVETTIPMNPTYAGIPIPEKTLFYESNPTFKTSYTQANNITFTLPDEAHDISTLFIGFSYYAYAIFGTFTNDIVCYYDSYAQGLTNKWYTNPTTHRYGVILNIKLKTP